ncbi:hypothetical protein FSARC_12432 [Fusarium sarcochroum]|uniref:Protein kinase domain-containing protein n=1 Tax=Fusarium sarcochroum TaxID=1208366 RepID=A0A8H4T8W7_9HYPO|nr:hypothetical protein FSARC_12432 [Fusarium sarcochroum]
MATTSIGTSKPQPQFLRPMSSDAQGNIRGISAPITQSHHDGHEVYERLREKSLPKSQSDMPLSQFLPRCDIESVLTPEVVDRLLVKVQSEPDCLLRSHEIWNEAHQQRRIKILALLVLIGKPKYIKYFLNHQVTDDDLPLPLGNHVLKLWKPAYREYFCARQHVVLAPVFDFGRIPKHHQFQPVHIMPFMESLKWKWKGTHGTISRAIIHDDHQSWEPHLASKFRSSCYAVKKFVAHDSADFIQERNALLRFSRPNQGHEHLIELLASYEQGDEYFMIFPWAQGNLAELWKRTYSNPTSREDWLWLIRQCQGLADGLCAVHNYVSGQAKRNSAEGASQTNNQNRGRHGDIKPENILYFEQGGSARGRLVIADFTLMRFHSEESVDITESGKVGFSPTYRPPERDDGSGTIVTQSYDIWTLGCVFLEFLSWHLLGHDAVRGEYFDSAGRHVESFRTMRLGENYQCSSTLDDKFFKTTFGSTATVKSSVLKWIDMLHRTEHCSTPLGSFLDLIKFYILVPDPQKRYFMLEVSGELERISSQDESRRGSKHGSSYGFYLQPYTKESKKYAKLEGTALRPTTPTSHHSTKNASNTDVDTTYKAPAPLPTDGHDNIPSQLHEVPASIDRYERVDESSDRRYLSIPNNGSRGRSSSLSSTGSSSGFSLFTGLLPKSDSAQNDMETVKPSGEFKPRGSSRQGSAEMESHYISDEKVHAPRRSTNEGPRSTVISEGMPPIDIVKSWARISAHKRVQAVLEEQVRKGVG